MKSSAHQTSPGCVVGRLAVLVALGALVSSCATTRRQLRTEPTGSSRMAPAVASQWFKVRSNPPTWYPRGTPADGPTDCRSGEWVCTEDALGTRYFIPLRGIAKERREALRQQALAARNPRKVARIACEDALHVAGACTRTLLIFTPPGLLALAANQNVPIEMGSMGSIDVGSIDVGNISVPCPPSMPGGCGGAGIGSGAGGGPAGGTP